jgi:RNA polymerase subunit RPABC4/transcription elongation factor Spt4
MEEKAKEKVCLKAKEMREEENVMRSINGSISFLQMWHNLNVLINKSNEIKRATMTHLHFHFLEQPAGALPFHIDR